MLRLSQYINQEIKTYPKESYIKLKLKMRIEPQFNAVYLIRKAQCARTKFFKDVYRRKLIKRYGIFIGAHTEIGVGLTMGHPNSIIIGDGVKIGQNVTIFQQTTIGTKGGGGGYPHIGNNCIIYAGAKIIGKIEIGDNCIIGANAVVTKSCPPNSILKGVPAKWTERKI